MYHADVLRSVLAHWILNEKQCKETVTQTIDCLGHAHEQNLDFQEALTVVGDVEHGTNYGDTLTRTC